MEHLRAQGYPVLDTDEARLSAFIRGDIGIDGHYASTCPTWAADPDSAKLSRGRKSDQGLLAA